MKVSFTLKIKQRSQPQWLCWLLIVMPFLFGTLIEWLRLPASVRYLLDVAWVAMLLMMVRLKLQNSSRRGTMLTIWAMLFFAYTLVGYMFLYQSPLYYLWGARNNFRFYVAVAAFCTFLAPEDVSEYFELFDKLFWINVAVSLIQYFFLGKQRDHLGGIFGVTEGCNGYSNIFFVIVLTKSVVFYMERREQLQKCVLKFVAVFFIAALAELKFFFAEAIIILVFATLFTNFSWRKVGIILVAGLCISAGAAIINLMFPYFGGFLSLEWFMDAASSDKGYTASGDLNRLNFITRIDKLFFDTPSLRLFGLGLGNCDSSNYAFLITPFSVRYSRLHYSWLSTAFTYVETGWVGLVFFFGFFVLAFQNARKIEKNCHGIAKTYCRIAKIMAIMCIAIAFYNSSLRTEAGYMAYFVLATPNVVSKLNLKKQIKAG